MESGDKVYCYKTFIYDICRNNSAFPSELAMYPHLEGRWYIVMESHHGEVWIYSEPNVRLANGRMSSSPFGYMNYSLTIRKNNEIEHHPYYFGDHFYTLKEYRKRKLLKLNVSRL
jgi:hypothetical protein